MAAHLEQVGDLFAPLLTGGIDMASCLQSLEQAFARR